MSSVPEMGNSTAPAANNDLKVDDPKNGKDQPAHGNSDAVAEDQSKEKKEPDAIETAASDAWSIDLSGVVSWGVNKAKDAAAGLASLVVPDYWSTNPEQPGSNTDGRQVAATKAEHQDKGWFGNAVDWVKGGVEKIAGAVSDAWKSVFEKDATIVEDKNPDGSKKGFTVSEKDGDVISATKDAVQIKQSDGTIISRKNGETTVEKDNVSITRDRNGRETFRLKDGTTGVVDANKELSVELKALHEKVNDRGVRGDLRTAEAGRITYFNSGRLRMSELTQDEKHNDVVQAADATRMALDKANGVFVERSTNPNEKTAIIRKEGSDDAVEVKQVDGKVLARVVKLDKDGKPIPGSEQEASGHRELPDWFKQYTAKRNNGQTPADLADAMRAAGIKTEGGDDITVTAANKLKLGPCHEEGGKTVCVEIPTGPNADQKIVLSNGGGTQKVNDVEHKQTTEYDGTNYSQKNDGVEHIKYNAQERHLELFDERGNRIADSTAQGTSFAGGYLGADGSYTGSDRHRYFGGTAQEMQYAASASQVALAGAEGHINNFRGQLANRGSTVDIGELASSMGSLTEALALCIKSGNLANLSQIIGSMGEVQDLIARGNAHNADVLTIRAAVPGATDLQIASTKPGPNDAAVAQLDKLLHEKNQRASA